MLGAQWKFYFEVSVFMELSNVNFKIFSFSLLTFITRDPNADCVVCVKARFWSNYVSALKGTQDLRAPEEARIR